MSDLQTFSSKIHQLPRLTIELTDRCNNNCQHCYINRPVHDMEARQKETTTGFIKEQILQAADLGCLNLRFTGGEPLLREDFSEIYGFSRRNGFKVHLSTNGRLITPEIAGLFKKLPPGKPIDITTYGMSSDTYDRVARGKGSFEEFRSGIRLLLENNIDFAVRMAVLPDNRTDVPLFEAWINDLFNGKQPPAYITDFYPAARRDNAEKNQAIRELRGKAGDSIEPFIRSDTYSGEMHDFCRQYTGVYSDRLFECGFADSLCIDAYGFAQGCLLLRHPDFLYDLSRGSLADAFRTFFPKFLDQRALNPLFLDRCARCSLRGLCAQCPAQSWMESGKLDTPVAFLCDIAHAHARKLGLLSESEYGWEVTDWESRVERYTGESKNRR